LLDELHPEFAEAIRRSTPIERARSWPGLPGRFRKAFGPGWALVGDAGYFKDPYAAHGISDAFRDAEMLADAVITGDGAGGLVPVDPGGTTTGHAPAARQGDERRAERTCRQT
jgi:flavin-dependent dehydrogenase